MFDMMFYIVRAKIYNSVMTLYYYMSAMRVYYLYVSYTKVIFTYFNLVCRCNLIYVWLKYM